MQRSQKAITLPGLLSLDQDFLTASNSTDIKSSTRYMPGISVFKGKRGQSAGYCIRGIGGGSDRGFGENRVVMTIDGERLPDFFNFGHESTRSMISGRNNVEFATIKKLDVVKGPRSVTEGNDAIGGVVGFRTYSPEDFVNENKKLYWGISHGFRSENKENKTSVTLAAKSGNISGMVIGTRTDGHEVSAYTDTQPIETSKRTSADPQWIDGKNILGKINIGNKTHKLSLSAENYYYKYKSYLLGTGVGSSWIPDAFLDTIRRKRYSAEYRLRPTNCGIDELKVKVYQQKLHNSSKSSSGTYLKGFFDQDINSVKTDLKGSFSTGKIDHAWLAGIEYRWKDTSRKEWNIKKGKVNDIENKTWLPDMSTKTYGCYLQYSMRMPFGLSIIPSVRFEKWEYEAHETKEYLATMPDYGHELASLEMDNTSISPKLLINQELTKNLLMYFSYASGFNNPPLSLITGMTRPGHFPILPGIDLEPEKTDNYELGFIWENKRLYANISGYLNRYEDMFGYSFGKSPITHSMGFLPYNVKGVDIFGFEANIKYNFLEDCFLRCLYSYAEGSFDRNEAPGIPDLGSDLGYSTWRGIEPHQMILGLGYESENFGGSIDWTMSGPVQHGTSYETPGYGIVDMNCWFKLKEHMEISAGIYNLFDRKYWQHIDLIEENVSEDFNKVLYQKYTQPGRSFAVKVNLHF